MIVTYDSWTAYGVHAINSYLGSAIPTSMMQGDQASNTFRYA